MAVIFKFPYDACRRVHSRKPRRSKNGTPEERAAKVEAETAKLVPATVVDLSEMMAEAPAAKVDRRKLRGNPLREKANPISFAVTVVGKIYTADLRGEPIDLDAEESKAWLDSLLSGAAAARFVADELDKAAARLNQNQGESEISHSPLNLPVPALGQSVLNFTTEHSHETSPAT